MREKSVYYSFNFQTTLSLSSAVLPKSFYLAHRLVESKTKINTLEKVQSFKRINRRKWKRKRTEKKKETEEEKHEKEKRNGKEGWGEVEGEGGRKEEEEKAKGRQHNKFASCLHDNEVSDSVAITLVWRDSCVWFYVSHIVTYSALQILNWVCRIILKLWESKNKSGFNKIVCTLNKWRNANLKINFSYFSDTWNQHSWMYITVLSFSFE